MKRREFVKNGSGSMILGAMVAGLGGSLEGKRKGPALQTALCKELGIQYPVIQAGMGNFAGPELAAAVSNAGGLGILGATMLPPEILREQIRTLRQLTPKPFGVNLLLQQDLYPPKRFQVSEQVAGQVHGVLNGFRRKLGIPESNSTPETVPPFLEQGVEVLIEEKVPLFSIGSGNPSPEIVEGCRERGIKIMAMVSTVEDALTVEASGADYIVAQGSEAGGHRSTWDKKLDGEYAGIGTLALVSQISRQVKVPVIAAGGIASGAAVAAALVLGAEGAMLGTYFATALESRAPGFYKNAVIASDSNSTTVTDSFTGMYARVIRNAFSEDYRKSGAPVLPPGIQLMAAMDIYRQSENMENPDYYTLYSGQGIDHIKSIRPAGEIISELVQDAERTLASYIVGN